MENKILLSGKIIKINYSHSIKDYNFYEAIVEVVRHSGLVDHIPLVFKEFFALDLEEGKFINIEGTIRSYSKREPKENETKLNVFVYLEDILGFKEENVNELYFNGKLCKKPNLRQTPKKRDICDLMVINEYRENKLAFVPVLTWGKDAIIVSGYKTNDYVEIEGRLQSREYDKVIGEKTITLKTYEICSTKIERKED